MPGDVNFDHVVSTLDALVVINQLNSSTPVPIAIVEPVDEEIVVDELAVAQSNSGIDSPPLRRGYGGHHGRHHR